MRKEALKVRKNTYRINPLIIARWSPRSMSGAAISDKDFHAILDAARWAPSSYNNQPWRFLYAKKKSRSWPLFFDFMVEGNQQWAKNAAVLFVVCSSKVFAYNKKRCHTHSFDTGAAWMCMALEAFNRGLVIHGMEGFDYDKARKVLKVPKNVQIECMIAVGKPAPKTKLSKDMQKREKPSDRNPLSAYAFEGLYPSAIA